MVCVLLEEKLLICTINKDSLERANPMKPELLSPAGGRESLEAAIKAGADAVYLGGPKFSARAYATNFDDDDLLESIRLCRRHGLKLYVTINTLLKDSELLEAADYLVRVWNMGVDAIIIQDPGLIWLIRHFYPEIELHASTQMTVHNLKGADYLKEKGIQRMVLARELTLEGIREISAMHETEVFIHGALCISYSGKCLMSSMLGGRSGNRGRCAQNCRMEYQLMDETGSRRAEGFLMSPRDLSTLDIVEKMKATGTASFKIEGRLKRPEYVFETVTQYRRALENREWDESGIKQLFNRQGFNHAFLLGSDGRDMMAYHSSKNSGIVLGRIRNGSLKLQTGLSLGDGVKAGDSGFIVTKIRVRGKEVSSARSGEICEIFPRNFKDDDLVIKTNDSVLLKGIQDEMKKKLEGDRPINMEACFKVGEPFRLAASLNGNQVEAAGRIVEASTGAPLTEKRIRDSLNKTGGTPFQVEELSLEFGQEPGFLPMSALNEVRRELLLKAEEALYRVANPAAWRSEAELTRLIEARAKETGGTALPHYLVTLSSKEQLSAYLDTTSKHTSHDAMPVLFLWHRQQGSLSLNDARELDDRGIPYWVRMPEILTSEFTATVRSVAALGKVAGLITDNYGVIEFFKDKGIPLVGDYKLNVINSAAGNFFPELQGITLSEELNLTETLAMKKKADKFLILYGRTELMHSEYCPIGSTVGGLSFHTPCTMPCQNMGFSLGDQKGQEFPIQTDMNCRSYILNSKVKNNLDQQQFLLSSGFSHFRMDLTTEGYEEACRAVNALLDKKELPLADYTRGHLRRGIE